MVVKVFLIVFLVCWCQTVFSSRIQEKCKTCKDLVKNFHKGMEKTGKKHFGGGDTAWEESRLGSYAHSETRLLVILEDVCVGASKESSCHAMVEEHEEELENFWFNKHDELSKLEEYFCINELKVCCANGKYGKQCKDCPGGTEKPCLGRGTCKGDGTRGGSGKCNCQKEYEGKTCDECAEGYYDAGNNTCKKCHESCELSCSDDTSKGCDSCKDGYAEHEEEGCVDKDECEDESICKEGTYCFNTKGSFRCHDCDPACDGGCTNSGRLSCTNCKDGWKLNEEGKGCDDVNECETPDICSVGTHCKNTDGSYDCESCHLSCSGGCSGDGPSACTECADGYHMSDEGCVDVNECTELKIACSSGHVCVNRDGPDSCEACDPSCIECTSTEEDACLQCKTGYTLEGGNCNDINECSTSPCNVETENCHNLQGSHKCQCKKGYARTKKGDCIKSKKGQTKKVEVKEDL